MTDYNPVTKPKIKTYAYNKVTATWKHGFKHSFICIGHLLRSELDALSKLEYVSSVDYEQSTEEEYRSFYGGSIVDEKEVSDKPAKKKNSKVEKVEESSMPQFSSLENFFDNKSAKAKKTPAKKTVAKKK
jgi:hypothetical protein